MVLVTQGIPATGVKCALATSTMQKNYVQESRFTFVKCESKSKWLCEIRSLNFFLFLDSSKHASILLVIIRTLKIGQLNFRLECHTVLQTPYVGFIKAKSLFLKSFFSIFKNVFLPIFWQFYASKTWGSQPKIDWSLKNGNIYFIKLIKMMMAA